MEEKLGHMHKLFLNAVQIANERLSFLQNTNGNRRSPVFMADKEEILSLSAHSKGSRKSRAKTLSVSSSRRSEISKIVAQEAQK